MEELVAELCEGHPSRILTIETLLDRVLSHHVVYGDELTYVTDEAKESIVLHPVIVIHEDSSIGSIAVEVEELR